MATASTADLQPVPASAKPPAPPDTGIAPPDTSKVEADFGGIEGALKGLASGMEAVDARTAKANQTIEDRIANLKMPQLELTPPPTVKQTDPVRVWSSNAMLFAGLASLLTRRPLLTAMKAAAGVINAYRAGDQAAADAAFKTWKVSQENAIKLADFQMEQYRAILTEADRAERLNDQEALRADRALQAEFNATATAFRDDIAIQTLKERGWYETQQLMIERQRVTDAAKKEAPKLEEMHIEHQAFMGAYAQLQTTEAFKKADPIQKYKMIQALLDKSAPKAAAQARAQFGLAKKATMDALNAERKKITDDMAAYQKAHAGVIADPKDPNWVKWTNQLHDVDARIQKAEQDFATKAEHLLETEDAGGGGDDKVWSSPSDVATAVKNGSISYDQGAELLREHGWAQ